MNRAGLTSERTVLDLSEGVGSVSHSNSPSPSDMQHTTTHQALDAPVPFYEKLLDLSSNMTFMPSGIRRMPKRSTPPPGLGELYFPTEISNDETDEDLFRPISENVDEKLNSFIDNGDFRSALDYLKGKHSASLKSLPLDKIHQFLYYSIEHLSINEIDILFSKYLQNTQTYKQFNDYFSKKPFSYELTYKLYHAFPDFFIQLATSIQSVFYHFAVAREDHETLISLIKRDSYLRIYDKPILIYAMSLGFFGFVKSVLIDNRIHLHAVEYKYIKFDYNPLDENGFSLLDYAHVFDEPELAEIIELNVNKNAESIKNPFSRTNALRLQKLAQILYRKSIEQENIQLFRTVCHLSKNYINLSGSDGDFTPLMILMIRGYVSFLNQIIEDTVCMDILNMQVEDENGFNLYDYAVGLKLNETADLLLQIKPELKKERTDSERLLIELSCLRAYIKENCVESFIEFAKTVKSNLSAASIPIVKSCEGKDSCFFVTPMILALLLNADNIVLNAIHDPVLSARINWLVQDEEGMNLMHHAFKTDKVLIMIALKQKYPEIENQLDLAKKAPLHYMKLGGLCEAWLIQKNFLSPMTFVSPRESQRPRSLNTDVFSAGSSTNNYDEESPKRIFEKRLMDRARQLSVLVKYNIISDSQLTEEERDLVRFFNEDGFTNVVKRIEEKANAAKKKRSINIF